MGRLHEDNARATGSEDQRGSSEPAGAGGDSAAQRGQSLAEIEHEFGGGEADHAEGLLRDGPHEAKPAYTPERIERLLRGQYRGLLKLYKRGELDEHAAIEKMMIYDFRLHGGAMSAEGMMMVPQLAEAMRTMPRDTGSQTQDAAPVEASAAPVSADVDAKPVPMPATRPTGHSVPHVGLGGDQECLISDLESAGAGDVAAQLRALGEVAHDLRKKLGHGHEESGANRDVLVHDIGVARRAVDALAVPGVDVTELKKRAHRRLNELSPYYSQGHNVDLIENVRKAKKSQWDSGTCSITSLATALEGIGIGTTRYKNPERLARIYEYFMNEEQNAKDDKGELAGFNTGGNQLLNNADDHVGGDVTGLRLPDFLELAAIAENIGDGASHDAIRTARYETIHGKWIQDIDNQRLLASRFGVSSEKHTLKTRGGSLKDWATPDRRNAVEKQVDRRNTGEGDAPSPETEAMLRGEGSPIELEQYKQQVLREVGGALDAGKGVMMNLQHHYVRVQSLDDGGVVVDDPGHQATGSARVVRWNEAMAMAYFARWLVLG
jgi:hypothetical protein